MKSQSDPIKTESFDFYDFYVHLKSAGINNHSPCSVGSIHPFNNEVILYYVDINS